jgi:hypothetical protein
VPLLPVHAVEVLPIRNGIQKLALHGRLWQTAPNLHLIGYIGLQGKCHWSGNRPHIEVNNRGTFLLVWKELRPVFADIEAKGLDEVGVKGPISVKLDHNEEMSQ